MNGQNLLCEHEDEASTILQWRMDEHSDETTILISYTVRVSCWHCWGTIHPHLFFFFYGAIGFLRRHMIEAMGFGVWPRRASCDFFIMRMWTWSIWLQISPPRSPYPCWTNVGELFFCVVFEDEVIKESTEPANETLRHSSLIHLGKL